jgi:hypothetical protein
MSHSLFLATAYAVACALWWATSRVVPLWRDPTRTRFAHPWRERWWWASSGRGAFGLRSLVVLGTVWRSADVAWFWPVHFALDMTQFCT